MIQTYKFNDTTQLSPHFNAKEFRCKCGKEHDFQISDEMIAKLEKLYETLNCSKIIVTSGYRCTAHDKNVGGNGTGQHTKRAMRQISAATGRTDSRFQVKQFAARRRISGSGESQISQRHISTRMWICVIMASGTAMKSTATAL